LLAYLSEKRNSPPEALTWQEIQLERAPFLVQFPASPVKSYIESPYAAVQYTTQFRLCRYTVRVAELTLETAEAELSQYGDPFYRRKIPNGALPGWDYVFLEGMQATRVHNLIFQQTLLQLQVEGGVEATSAPECDHFLGSLIPPRENKFLCLIDLYSPSESGIRMALERTLPSLRWEEGDSSWDKIRVWGTGPGIMIRVYRYEEPGPFDLTITIKGPQNEETRETYLALRDKVLQALGGRLLPEGGNG
jgi:hypothetical protein